jgi:succinate dehydrogenase/fumarate reductase cytochrome b subunit
MTQPIALPHAAANPCLAQPARSTLDRVQALSGSVFLVFALVHVLNTALAAVSVQTYDTFQTRARAFYQHPLLEVALLATLLLHVACAILRVRNRARTRTHTNSNATTRSAHRYAGWFLLVVIFGHIAFTRGPSLVAGEYPGFMGVSYAIRLLPWVSYPYFALLIAAIAVHATLGAGKALNILGVTARSNAGWRRHAPAALVVVVIAFGWLGVLGLGGALYTTADPAHGEFAAWVGRYFNL